MTNSEFNEEEIIDKTADQVMKALGSTQPVRIVRKSRILSALLGATGFALFVDGIVKLFIDFPYWASLSLGLTLMIITGLLVKNLYR